MTRTVVAESYGGPEVLAVQDIDLPEPGPGQVFVDVRAAGTNPIDYKLYSGDMGRDPDRLPMPLGMEVAGVVAATGSGAQGYTGALTVGDEVIATGIDGGRILRAGACRRVRRRAQARVAVVRRGGWPSSGRRHRVAPVDEYRVGMNDTVLIHGASGGVGLMAVQLAMARGARVIATASPARHDQLRAYGAEPVEYGAGLTDRVRAIGSVDAALDLVGTDEALDTSVALVADRTRIATIVGFGRAAELGIAALSGADGGQAIRDASRPEVLRTGGRRQVGGDGGQGLSVGAGRRSPSVPADGARPRKSRTGSLAS